LRLKSPSFLASLSGSAQWQLNDAIRDGKPVVGYGFNSNGRYGQGKMMRDRFIPRIMERTPDSLVDDSGTNLDPHKIWNAMFTNEKPGGHGERSVAIGTIDMAVWDAVAKIEGKPLFQLLADPYGNGQPNRKIFVYTAGGYYYPGQDYKKLQDEMKSYIDRGYGPVHGGHSRLRQGRQQVQRNDQEGDGRREVGGPLRANSCRPRRLRSGLKPEVK
jgi:L-alanine-DL-glutamate epimerase-like enolase superfamily enzyme